MQNHHINDDIIFFLGFILIENLREYLLIMFLCTINISSVWLLVFTIEREHAMDLICEYFQLKIGQTICTKDLLNGIENI